jgi:hypothetical protein
MTETPGELYIPQEKLNENVKRMAWLLFLEEWKTSRGGRESTAELEEWVSLTYSDCLTAAKVVWHEQEKGYEQDLPR